MKTKALIVVLAAAGIATGTAGATGWNPSDWFAPKPPAAAAAPTVTPSAPARAVLMPTPAASPLATAPIGMIAAPNYRAIVERYGSAVVGINTQGMAKTAMNGADTDIPDDPFFQFFRRIPRHDVPVRGQGSGFIVSSDGLILTNAHVVRDADEVTVKLSDRREYKAKVLGSDLATDVAVLKINAGSLPVVSLGNPTQLGVGDYVLAIGSPFGFEQSATAGIVSAKGRSLPGDGYVPFIQTDVAVNPGNSGGPLFDASGAVVGINSQIYSQTGGYQGVSFAIPIDVALQVKDQIVKTGKVSHARLGVSIQELNQTLAESFKLSRPDGALVSSVTPGSPAARAGVEPGDVIQSYNGQPILRSGDLPALVGMSKPGEKASLTVWRAGKKVELSATLNAATDKLVAGEGGNQKATPGKLGVAVRALTPDERRQANLPAGVLVEQSAGAAARAGIQPGDVILAVNGTPVKSVTQLQELVAPRSTHMAVLIQRGEAQLFIPVTLG